jgi:glutamate/aspartate transport system substrate-binding protein
MRLRTLGFILLGLAAMEPVWAGALDSVRQDKVLRIAYRTDVPPFSSAKAGEAPSGFSIDLCRMIADRLAKQLGFASLNVAFVPVDASDRLQAIVDHRADLECGTTTVTFARLEKVDFSSLFYITGTSLMTRSDSKIRSFDDLGGHKLAVTKGTTTDRVVTERMRDRHVDIDVVRVANNHVALDMLLDNKVAAMAGDQATLLGLGMTSGRHSDLQMTADMLSVESLAFPLPRNDADFRLAVNRALSDIYISGDVGRSWTKWFAPFGVKPTSLLLELYRLNSFAEQ